MSLLALLLLSITIFSIAGLILHYLPRKTTYKILRKTKEWNCPQLKEKVKWLQDLDSFYLWLVTLAVLGASWAFLSPIAFNLGLGNDDGSRLRQMILYATGGLLGVMTLVETRRRNNQEKQKNVQEHMRQVHAERRSRYATAIEQLADEKAPIRLGGVYTLVKLVDDWLDDKKTLPSEDKRRQEGQIIVNSLCAYIRSSFPLAERHEEFSSDYEDYKKKCQNNKIKIHILQSYKNSIKDFSFGNKNSKYNNQPIQSREEFARDKSLFREEQEVRKTILSEIKKRLNGNKDKHEDDKGEVKPGTWSYFDYIFSNTVFFYPVDLSNSYFGASSKFSKTYFTGTTDFSGVKFTKGAYFFDAEFTKDAGFIKDTNFSKARFPKGAEFFFAGITRNAGPFEDANFSRAEFTETANFSGVKFTGVANFSWARFPKGTEFFEDANFSGAEFIKSANFIRADFAGGANFSSAKFTGTANFSEAIFKYRPEFAHPVFSKHKAKFSHKANPEDYNFKVSFKSEKIIFEDPQPEHNGVKFTIPKGAILFDPDDPSEQEDNGDS